MLLINQMLRRLTFLTPLTIFIALVWLLWHGLGINPHRIPSPLIGKPAPHFILPQLAHPNEFIDDKIFDGHVTLLNVWASWCNACQDEHDLLMQMSHDKRIALVGLNYKDNRDNALRWLDKLGNPYHTIIYDFHGKAGIDWGVYGTPETFIIDANGIVRYKHIGPITDEVWRDTLLPLVLGLVGNKT